MKSLLDGYLSLVKRYFPDKKSDQPCVGLDIGSHSCKAVELIPTADSFEIVNWIIEPIGRHGPATAIKRVLDKLNIHSKTLSTAITGQGTLIRFIDMPKMRLEDARRSFAIEADKYFPFAKEQIYTDCYIVSTDNQHNKMSLLVAAAKKDIVERRIQLLSELGFEVDFIGINSIAISNVFNVLKQHKEKGSEQAKSPQAVDLAKTNAIAILDIGDSITSLIIIKDDVPLFTRDIFIGGREFNQRISNVLAVDVTEAEKMKCDSGDKLESITSACEAILHNLVSEVRLSFDYFATEHNIQVPQLFLTGGSSQFPGISEFFSKNLETPVEKWNPLGPFKLSASISAPEINSKASYLGVALGLALYQS